MAAVAARIGCGMKLRFARRGGFGAVGRPGRGNCKSAQDPTAAVTSGNPKTVAGIIPRPAVSPGMEEGVAQELDGLPGSGKAVPVCGTKTCRDAEAAFS